MSPPSTLFVGQLFETWSGSSLFGTATAAEGGLDGNCNGDVTGVTIPSGVWKMQSRLPSAATQIGTIKSKNSSILEMQTVALGIPPLNAPKDNG